MHHVQTNHTHPRQAPAGAWFHPRPASRLRSTPHNSARQGRAAGSSRTPTPTAGLVSYRRRCRGAAHRGRCALRFGWCKTITSGRGWNPASTGLAKAKPESNPNACGVSPFPQRLLEEMRPFSASTTSVDISNRRRPKGGRILVLNRYPGRPTPYISAQPAYRAQTSDRTSKARGRGGWDASSPMGALSPYKSRFSLGRHSRFFGQGPKKWGGIYIFSPR